MKNPDDVTITVDGHDYAQPNPRRLPTFGKDLIARLTKTYSLRLNALRTDRPAELAELSDANTDETLRDAAWAAMAYVSGVTGLPLPGAIPPIFHLSAEEMYYVETGIRGQKSDPRGTTYGSTAVGGAYMMLLEPFDLTDPYRHSVLVHEMTHYVQAKSGQRHMGIDLAAHGYFDLVEYEAYKAQAQWLWEKGLNPRQLDALGPHNIFRATRSRELADFNWLPGWDNSPMRLEETAEARWTREHEPEVPTLMDLLESMLSSSRRLRFTDSKLSDLDAIFLVQGGSRDTEEYLAAFQHLLDNSLVKPLGECYVSEARGLIARGKLEPKGW